MSTTTEVQETTAGAPTTAPMFLPLDQTDDDIVDDLAAIGVALTPGYTYVGSGGEEAVRGFTVALPDEAARIDAMASVLLRKLADLNTDLAQHLEAYDLERAALRARYERRTETARIQYEQIEAWVRDLARVQAERGGFGKKRSRDTGHGTYGVRTAPAKVDVADDAAFAAWAETVAPELLRVTLKLPLAVAREYLTDAELAAVKREVLVTPVREYAKLLDPAALPPGLVQTPERVEPFAKPEPLPTR